MDFYNFTVKFCLIGFKLKSIKLSQIGRGGVKLLKNTGLPENPENVSDVMIDDIPEAVRDISTLDADPSLSQSRRKLRFWLLLGLGILTFAITLWLNDGFSLFARQSPENIQPPQQEQQQANLGSQLPSSQSAAASANSSLEAENSTDSLSDGLLGLLGHLPYEEAAVEDLQKITADGGIKLKPSAAQAFLTMLDAARAQGIQLVPLSGFRSVAQQEYLFFDIKAQRGQDTMKRAEVSAPPGYSEHHTGYAIDMGDADYPEAYLEVSFEQTPAFQWLAENAAHYSFELSFPEGNPQGVSYEPWHWRYVGDRNSLETFYKQRSERAILEKDQVSADDVDDAE